MQIDKTTLEDIGIFSKDNQDSIINKLDCTKSKGGSIFLNELFSKPLDNIPSILDTQNTIRHLQGIIPSFPESITNGTIMVMQHYFDAVIPFPSHPNWINCHYYRMASKPNFKHIQFFVEHFLGFASDMHRLMQLFPTQASKLLTNWRAKMEAILGTPSLAKYLQQPTKEKMSAVEIICWGKFIKQKFKNETLALVSLFHEIDAYMSLAVSSLQLQFNFPSFTSDASPYFEAKELFHPLLKTPIKYDLLLEKQKNFLFLTGANMAGKSTFIKSLGISIYLAHIGMGVPAAEMKISLFDGLLSNIQVTDNIMMGESFFFNEVRRIKKTVEQASNGKNWMVLVDELFKGTNVQDAMKCSTAVVEGLRKIDTCIFILSSHLYEIAEGLMKYDNIDFKYFETIMDQVDFRFNYQLKNGISNDRLGYLILEKEGVVRLLDAL